MASCAEGDATERQDIFLLPDGDEMRLPLSGTRRPQSGPDRRQKDVGMREWPAKAFPVGVPQRKKGHTFRCDPLLSFWRPQGDLNPCRRRERANLPPGASVSHRNNRTAPGSFRTNRFQNRFQNRYRKQGWSQSEMAVPLCFQSSYHEITTLQYRLHNNIDLLYIFRV